MTNEERDIIGQFVARVGGAAQAPATSAFNAGSVPATQPALPPIDRDADNFISQCFTQYPEARYRITQLAFVQEHALAEAQNRIQRLEWELQQAQQAVQQAQQQSQQRPSGGGGFLGGLFGGGSRPQAQAAPQPDARWNQGAAPQQQQYYQAPPPPPPQYAPSYQPGMFQQGRGSGFLGSALTTAAGVAGGMVAGNALMNLFSGHQGYGGGFAGGMPMGGNPWGAPGQVDTASWGQGGMPAGNQDYVDNGTWDQPTGGDSAWSDNSGADSSSDNSGDSSWSDDSGGGSDSGGSSDDTF